jgi:hypothetical protein
LVLQILFLAFQINKVNNSVHEYVVNKDDHECKVRVFNFMVEGGAIGIGKSTLVSTLALILQDFENVIPLVIEDCIDFFTVFGVFDQKYLSEFYSKQAESAYHQQLSIEICFVMSFLAKVQERLERLMIEYANRDQINIVILSSRDMMRSVINFGCWNVCKMDASIQTWAIMAEKMKMDLELVQAHYDRIMGQNLGCFDLENLFRFNGQLNKFFKWGYDNMIKRGRIAEIEVFDTFEKYSDVFTRMNSMPKYLARTFGSLEKLCGCTVANVDARIVKSVHERCKRFPPEVFLSTVKYTLASIVHSKISDFIWESDNRFNDEFVYECFTHTLECPFSSDDAGAQQIQDTNYISVERNEDGDTELLLGQLSTNSGSEESICKKD